MEKEWTEAADLSPSPPPPLVQIYYPPCCSICQNETGVGPVFLFSLSLFFFFLQKKLKIYRFKLNKMFVINFPTKIFDCEGKWKIEGGRERESSFNFIAADRIVDVASLPSALLVNPPPSSRPGEKEGEGRSGEEGGGRNGS